jgi:hypothetical protein
VEQARRAFLEEQVRGLEPFGFVLLAVPDGPELGVEVERSEDGASYGVAVIGRPPLPPEVTTAAASAGLAGTPPIRGELDVEEAAELAERLLVDVLHASEESSLDFHHGSKRLQILTRRKLVTIRERIGRVVSGITELGPWTVDDDGDHTTAYGSTRLYVGPRALLDGTIVVLVFAPTTIGIEPTPELGLFLSEANFRLAFGRFALDAAHGVVWFGQNLLGDGFMDEELAFVVRMVASTSDSFDEEIAARFGGQPSSVVEEKPAAPEPPSKPGEGGYL